METPDSPIADPWFSMMEVLILLSTPMMVVLMVGVHAWAPHHRAFSLAAVVFMASTAVVTCGVHFTVLVLGHRSAVEALPWAGSLLSFTWPSVPYALDILAWDVFFAISVLLAVPVFSSTPGTRAIRWSLLISGVLSFAGLLGVALDDMQLRTIGVVGYAVVFPVAVVFLAHFFHDTSKGSHEPS